MTKQPFSLMIGRLNRFSATLVVAGILLLALPVLAIFQYRWLGQLSESELNRMKSNLRLGGQRFSADLDEMFGRVTDIFQLRNSVGTTATDLSSSLAEWRSTDHPALLRSIHVASAGIGDPPGLMRFDFDRLRLTPAVWAPSMKTLRDRLSLHGDVGGERNRLITRRVSSVEEFPWLAIPVVPEKPDVSAAGLRVDYIVLEMDTAYLSATLIPELLKRHFPGVADYAVQIRRLDDRSVVYSSPEADFRDGTADYHERVGSLRLLDVVLMTTVETGRKAMNHDISTTSRAGGKMGFSPLLRSPDVQPVQSALWDLQIKHRSGSLEAAVSKARFRNILISGFVFVFLTLSVVLLMRAARNARRLAQMELEFVAGVSHELRTPLAVIRSAGENLADGVVKDPDQIRNYGRIVYREGQRLSDMLEQVLAFAGSEAGQMMLKREPMNLKDLIVESLEELEATISGKEFFVSASLSDEIPEIYADRYAMRTVFRNLLDNALKYGRKEGHVEILGTVEEENGRDLCRIAIQDDGLGISKEDLPHIFEPFYRGRKVRQMQIRGNGLGLSLVKKVVEAHGGRITAESTDGHGSVFTVYLPTAKPDEPSS